MLLFPADETRIENSASIFDVVITPIDMLFQVLVRPSGGMHDNRQRSPFVAAGVSMADTSNVGFIELAEPSLRTMFWA